MQVPWIMDITEFVKDLNIILKMEYGAVMQYVLHAYRFSKAGEKEIAKEIPQEEWDKLPADLTDRLDYYLYEEPYE